jgi:hypothetical protein
MHEILDLLLAPQARFSLLAQTRLHSYLKASYTSLKVLVARAAGTL